MTRISIISYHNFVISYIVSVGIHKVDVCELCEFSQIKKTIYEGLVSCNMFNVKGIHVNQKAILSTPRIEVVCLVSFYTHFKISFVFMLAISALDLADYPQFLRVPHYIYNDTRVCFVLKDASITRPFGNDLF